MSSAQLPRPRRNINCVYSITVFEVKIEEPSPLQLTILPDYHGAIPQPPLYKHCGGQLLDRGAVVKLVY